MIDKNDIILYLKFLAMKSKTERVKRIWLDRATKVERQIQYYDNTPIEYENILVLLEKKNAFYSSMGKMLNDAKLDNEMWLDFQEFKDLEVYL